MDNPLISIVLPVYNGERYLAEAIESCISQTFRNWELIIVDDCSLDATPSIIQRYASADDRIRSIRHEINKKLPAALNAGFKQASGQYYTWTSDDNRYHPTALAIMVEYLDRHLEFSIVYTDFAIIDEAGGFIGTREVSPPDDLVFQNSVGACFLYRSEVHRGVGGYNEALFLVEDFEFWLRVSQNYRLCPIHIVLYDYRMHSSTLTAVRGIEITRKHLLLLWEHLPRMGWAGERKVVEGYAWVARTAMNEGYIVLGWRAWLKAAVRSPVLGIRMTRHCVFSSLVGAKDKLIKKLGHLQ